MNLFSPERIEFYKINSEIWNYTKLALEPVKPLDYADLFSYFSNHSTYHILANCFWNMYYHRKAPIMALQTIKTETDASCNPIWIVRHAGWNFCFGILHYHGNVSVAGYNKADLENATGKQPFESKILKLISVDECRSVRDIFILHLTKGICMQPVGQLVR